MGDSQASPLLKIQVTVEKTYKDDKSRSLAYRVNAADNEEAILGLSK